MIAGLEVLRFVFAPTSLFPPFDSADFVIRNRPLSFDHADTACRKVRNGISATSKARDPSAPLPTTTERVPHAQKKGHDSLAGEFTQPGPYLPNNMDRDLVTILVD